MFIEIPDSIELTEAIQALSWGVGVIGTFFLLYKGLQEIKLSRENSESKLRWDRAEFAKKLDDEVRNDPLAANAMLMLDGTSREFTLNSGKKFACGTSNIAKFMDLSGSQVNDETRFVRDCLDALFRHFKRQEHYISIELASFSDIRGNYVYYVRNMSKQKDVFENYLRKLGYNSTLEFLERFNVWMGTKPL